MSYRDGQYGIVEGQKRKLAKMMVDSEGTLVCHIYRGLTEQDEYQLFSQLNNGKRSYGTNEDYEARSQFDPKWKYVIECANKAGFSIVYSGGAKENTFGCPATIEEVYDELGDIDFTDMLIMLYTVCNISLQSSKKSLKKYSLIKQQKQLLSHAFLKLKKNQMHIIAQKM